MMKQTLSEFIDAKRSFFNKHANSIKSRLKDKDRFAQEVFSMLQDIDPSNEREIPAFEYLAGLLVTRNRSRRYEHPLGKAHMFTDIIMNHLEITKKTQSQIIREERERAVKNMDRGLQANFKKLYALNGSGLDVYTAVKEYPSFIQKLVLLSYIVSQPSLSNGDQLKNIYTIHTEPTKYQQLIVQLSLEKIIRNSLFVGTYDQLIDELCFNHNANATKSISSEKVKIIFQTFIKSYTDPAVIFSQTAKIQQDRVNILQKSKKNQHYTPQEVFFHAWLFYCSYMINAELIRESFLIYRDQTQQQSQEGRKNVVKANNEATIEARTASRDITQEQAIIAEEIIQRIINTYGCFDDYASIYKYLCRVISNKGTIVSHGLASKLQEIGIPCREQSINYFLKTIQKTAAQHSIVINIPTTTQHKLRGIASEQIQEVFQGHPQKEKQDHHKQVQTVGDVIELFERFGIKISSEKKIDNLIQEHIINKGNHKKMVMVLYIRSQLHSNSISASQVKIVSLKKNKYKTIAFNDGTRIIVRENTILDICNHNDYENKRIPKFQQ